MKKDMNTTATIIYLNDQIMISKKEYSDWHEIQKEFPDYISNLTPMTESELIQYLNEEYSSPPFSENEIVRFFKSNDIILRQDN